MGKYYTIKKFDWSSFSFWVIASFLVLNGFFNFVGFLVHNVVRGLFDGVYTRPSFDFGFLIASLLLSVFIVGAYYLDQKKTVKVRLFEERD